MTSSVRLAADTERLRALAAASGGRIAVVALPAPGSPRFVLDLGFATAGSSAYPAARRTTTRVHIDLPARYPFMPPAATIATPIFHPNVYPSGLVCLGTKWLPSEGMDLFVRRIAQLVTFDPLIVNAQSAANPAALHWYVQALRKFPQAFPTDRIDIETPDAQDARIRWNEATAAGAARVIRKCPHCGAGLRLPVGRRGTVRCPKCARGFEADT
jgi:Ubiquitin-conjugating enzyme